MTLKISDKSLDIVIKCSANIDSEAVIVSNTTHRFGHPIWIRHGKITKKNWNDWNAQINRRFKLKTKIVVRVMSSCFKRFCPCRTNYCKHNIGSRYLLGNNAAKILSQGNFLNIHKDVVISECLD